MNANDDYSLVWSHYGQHFCGSLICILGKIHLEEKKCLYLLYFQKEMSRYLFDKQGS